MTEAITMATREQRRRDHYLTEQPWNEPRSEWRRGRAGTFRLRLGATFASLIRRPSVNRTNPVPDVSTATNN
jgi:hypothetical protein